MFFETVSLCHLGRRDSICLRNNCIYSLKDPSINDAKISRFTTLVRNNITLEAFSLEGYNDKISFPVWRSLMDAMLRHPLITYIRFEDDVLSSSQATVFAEVLLTIPDHNIENLTLSYTQNQNMNVFVCIFEGLRHSKALQSISIYSPVHRNTEKDTENIKNRLCHSLGDLIQQVTTLKEISLYNLDCDDVVATGLATGLQSNASLLKAFYVNNNLENDGARAIAKSLYHNTHLTTLDVSDNQIGDDGAIEIAECLKYSNKSLTELSIGNNHISVRGFKVFADTIKYNTSLLGFHCENNKNCTDLDAIVLLEALQYNTTLRHLHIQQGNKSSMGKVNTYNMITEVLDYNDTITNIITSHALGRFDKMIKNEKSLRIAIKKGGRVRDDVFTWLFQNWVKYSGRTKVQRKINRRDPYTRNEKKENQ